MKVWMDKAMRWMAWVTVAISVLDAAAQAYAQNISAALGWACTAAWAVIYLIMEAREQ